MRANNRKAFLFQCLTSVENCRMLDFRGYDMITPLGREQLEGLDAAWEELAEGIETIRETNRRTK